jgi:hypothetical protein
MVLSPGNRSHVNATLTCHIKSANANASRHIVLPEIEQLHKRNEYISIGKLSKL